MPVVCEEDRLLVEAADYEWWLESYHLTPSQVDDLPWWLSDRIRTVAGVKAKLRQAEHDEAINRARDGAG